MKKILAVVLALAMMATLCVTSFAATIDKDSVDQYSDVNVYTKTTNTGGEDAYKYSVTIPAEIAIDWEDTSAQNAAYTVDAQLLLGATLKVEVTGNNENKMTNAQADPQYFLTFALGGTTSQTYPAVTDNVTSDTTVTVADFSGVPIAEYTGTLTYTVTYNAPTP